MSIVSFCDCGKISSHKGMCAARWAKRRQNAAAFVFDDALVADRPRMLRMAMNWTNGNKALAEDMLSEAMIKILAARDSFAVGTNFAAWCTTILKNVRNDNARRAAVRKTESINVEVNGETRERIDPSLVTRPAQEDNLIVNDMARDLLNNTTFVQRDVILRSGLEGQSYKDIAVATGMSEGTVMSRASRGRAKLEARVIKPVSRDNANSIDFVLDKLREERARIDKAIAALEQCRVIFTRGT